MSTTRMPLTIVLEVEFKNDKVKQKCCESSQAYLKAKGFTRVFNDFPQMLFYSEQDGICHSILECFSNIQTGQTRMRPSHFAAAWCKAILQRGFEELVEAGGLNSRLVHMLGWNKVLDSKIKQEEVVGIIQSYFNAINSQVFNQLGKMLLKHTPIYHEFTAAINEHVKEWCVAIVHANLEKHSADRVERKASHPSHQAKPVSLIIAFRDNLKEEAKKAGIVDKPSKPTPKKHFSDLSPLEVGIGLAAAGASLGLLFFKLSGGDKPSGGAPHPLPKPPR